VRRSQRDDAGTWLRAAIRCEKTLLDTQQTRPYRLSHVHGIVEEAGQVEQIRAGRRSTELTVRASGIGPALRVGNSVAVNGACLTVIGARRGVLKFDVLNETIQRTNLEFVQRGSLVNLERPSAPMRGSTAILCWATSMHAGRYGALNVTVRTTCSTLERHHRLCATSSRKAPLQSTASA